MEDREIPELAKCSFPERRRKEEEWAKLGNLSVNVAIRKFLDIVDDIFPNWYRNSRLYTEFAE